LPTIFGYSCLWKCSNYNIDSNRSNPYIPVANTINPTGCTEHALLEYDNNFDPFSNTLEDLLAHEETQSRKKVSIGQDVMGLGV